MHQCIKFILSWNDTLHVSDGLSVHNQEFQTVHTATGICQTDIAVCLLAGTKWNRLKHVEFVCLFVFGAGPPPYWARASLFTMFLDHTQRRTIVGRVPLDE